jgi:hypothetical protein
LKKWKILRSRKVRVNPPQSTSESPQINHENTTQKTHFSQNTPQKRQQSRRKPRGPPSPKYFLKTTAAPTQ